MYHSLQLQSKIANRLGSEKLPLESGIFQEGIGLVEVMNQLFVLRYCFLVDCYKYILSLPAVFISNLRGGLDVV